MFFEQIFGKLEEAEFQMFTVVHVIRCKKFGFDFNSPAVSHQCTGGQGANLLPQRMIHLTITIYSPIAPSNGYLTLNITTVPINRDIARISNKSGNLFLQFRKCIQNEPLAIRTVEKDCHKISLAINFDLSMRNFSLRFFGRGC